ncbi:matrixin family metalloprotease [Singulisphaera sp. PoT]|uniref:matrixin family metalloprotease n=1 Tax=Singulisphaera sp. PoT TaxID=3411797 RepID=UPI003BF56D0C
MKLERLEERTVLSTYGVAWPDPQHLTISFVPDGTQDGGSTSSLYQTLGATNADAWQLTVLRAFQTWTNYANLNISVTGDSGLPFGTPGSLQEDTRFGDIRVGAVPQSDSTAALTQEFQYGAGTWAGDVNLNSLDNFTLDPAGNPGSYDLFSVALHEAGHALGLPDNDDPTSIMYTNYNGVTSGLSASDIKAIQDIYGPRTPNGFNGATGNNSQSTAAAITPVNLLGTNGTLPNVTVGAAITSPQTVNYYKVTVPGLIPYAIQLNTSGLSSLLAKMSVKSASGQTIATVSATDPRNGNLSVTLPLTLFPTTYYIAVQGASSDVFGVGSYQLRASTPTALVSNLLTWTSDQVINGYLNIDLGLNSTPATATNLLKAGTQSGPTTYTIRGSVSFPGNIHDYSVVVPTTSSSAPVTMTASVWGVTLNPVDAVVKVYDSSGQQVQGNVIQHSGNTYVVQIPNATPGARYDLVVGAYQPTDLTLLGNYQLAVNFGTVAESQATLSSGTFANTGGSYADAPGSTISLTFDHDTLYNFVLSAATAGYDPSASVIMTITNEFGKVVGRLVTRANQVQSLAIWLAQGTYTVSVQGADRGRYPDYPLSWSLVGESLSDPISTLKKGNSSPTTSKTN